MSTSIRALSAREAERVETLHITIRQETPFLPKVAFVLISLASFGGALFTGLGLGVSGGGLVMRWLSLWSMALVGGFLVWRLIYLRTAEAQVDPARTNALNESVLDRADTIARWCAPVVLVGAGGALFVPVLDSQPLLRFGLVAVSIALAVALAFGVRRVAPAWVALAFVVLLLVGWSLTDVGPDWRLSIRVLHLSAFTLWLGGALFNIAVAMPAARLHPNVDAVLAGAKQLDRFRWVVRFALPTIIVTGVVMASEYRTLPLDWWLSLPGIMIPLKVLAIVALVVVFITCPLFRHCSPVQGVCNTEDLGESVPGDGS